MKNKKIKPSRKRVTGEKVNSSEIIKDVSLKTGFHHTNVDEVMKCYFSTLSEHLKEKRAIKIPQLGTFIPYIMKRRNTQKEETDLFRWFIGVDFSDKLSDEINKEPISKEELNKIIYF
ncbi:hypothetical protein [Tenacibaculum phage Larrie]|nr:hypothetical protein [Tenacibaculum phage Larrie]